MLMNSNVNRSVLLKSLEHAFYDGLYCLVGIYCLVILSSQKIKTSVLTTQAAAAAAAASPLLKTPLSTAQQATYAAAATYTAVAARAYSAAAAAAQPVAGYAAVAGYGREYADPYLGHGIGPVAGYGVFGGGIGIEINSRGVDELFSWNNDGNLDLKFIRGTPAAFFVNRRVTQREAQELNRTTHDILIDPCNVKLTSEIFLTADDCNLGDRFANPGERPRGQQELTNYIKKFTKHGQHLQNAFD
ncbi:hypothetical protein WN51_03928 [Melipona quadrifasciata]|uniref:Uncharacterized protein n=1 Tax=Melipona quadrifasciata TaxID=166423 RepID=A0A0N0BC36_9HYME|nr:hypothetical protein WN51_03928 [Melipona quadrifasciata]